MSHLSRAAALLLTIGGALGCNTGTPTITEAPGAPLNAAKGGGQTLYALTFATGLQTGSIVFSRLAKTNDPFSGIGGANVRLIVPASAAGNPAVCDADGSGLGNTTNGWGGYVGDWNGTLDISKRRGLVYFSYRANRADGSGGFLNLDVHAPAAEGNSGGVVTIAITNGRGLVGATSTPDGGAFDAVDRCLTFSVTATP